MQPGLGWPERFRGCLGRIKNRGRGRGSWEGAEMRREGESGDVTEK